jgi:hypothetical protein
VDGVVKHFIWLAVYRTINSELFLYTFFTQEGTPHILRFVFITHAVIISASPQETVREAGIKPRTAAVQYGVTTEPQHPQIFLYTTGTLKKNKKQIIRI